MSSLTSTAIRSIGPGAGVADAGVSAIGVAGSTVTDANAGDASAGDDSGVDSTEEVVSLARNFFKFLANEPN